MKKHHKNKQKQRPDVKLKILKATFLLALIALCAGFLLIFLSHLFESHLESVVSTETREVSSEEISHGDTSRKQVIFTFDGGSGPGSTRKVLDVLEKHHVKGTFFLTGKFIEANPDLVKLMVARGGEIFNHTYDHPHLPDLSDAQIVHELNAMSWALQNVASTSPHPKPYFRPPFGDRTSRVLAVAASAGYQSIYWSLDALDWKETDGETAESVKARILAHVAFGNIYLMHLGDTITGAILDDVFTKIEAQGYKIVSLTEGL